MVIEVLYKSFRYEKFDSSAQTNSEPFRAKGTNILTDWNLYLGALEENGIILAEHWYDGNPQHAGGQVTLEGTKVPAATRQVGSAMLLVSPDELDDVVWLKKDGEKLLWREGDELINGERFFAMEQLCYSDATVQSVNRRAIAVFDYLKHAHRMMRLPASWATPNPPSSASAMQKSLRTRVSWTMTGKVKTRKTTPGLSADMTSVRDRTKRETQFKRTTNEATENHANKEGEKNT